MNMIIVISFAILFAVIIYSKQITDLFITIIRKKINKKNSFGRIRFAQR